MKVKICCIQSAHEAQMAIAAGASAIGLVSAMPGGPGVISERRIAEIAKSVPAHIATFLLTSKTNPEEIIQQHRKVKTSAIQIVDRLKPADYKILNGELQGVLLVQVVHVMNKDSCKEALSIAEYADAILLDSGNPHLAIKELGGTGRTHNWDLSREIVEKAGIPVYLAGGLNPENVRQAVKRVQPFAVDVCSGVRTGGRLDELKLAKFFSRLAETGK